MIAQHQPKNHPFSPQSIIESKRRALSTICKDRPSQSPNEEEVLMLTRNICSIIFSKWKNKKHWKFKHLRTFIEFNIIVTFGCKYIEHFTKEPFADILKKSEINFKNKPKQKKRWKKKEKMSQSFQTRS